MQEKRTYKAVLIGDIIAPVLKKLIGDRGFICMEVLQHWRSIVPLDLSSCSIPISCHFFNKREEGVLYIKCSPGMGAYISYNKERILQPVNQLFGYQAINRIHVQTDFQLMNIDRDK